MSKGTDMTAVFEYAAVLDAHISDWDVSSVTNMDVAFYNAAAFDQYIGDWDVDSVTYMDYAFYNSGLQDCPSWADETAECPPAN